MTDKENHTVTEGQNITLKCAILNFDSDPTPPHLEWVKHVMVNGSFYGTSSNGNPAFHTERIKVRHC